MAVPRPKMRFIDIGANLTDPMFRGVYMDKQTHQPDLSAVLNRAYNAGLTKIMITGGNLDDTKEALKMTTQDARLYTTAGVHPTRCTEFLEKFDSETKYFDELRAVIKEGKDKIVAIGEFGLDYDRLNFCPVNVQKEYFEKQFVLAEEFKLPLFLHMRNAAQDFAEIVSRNRHRFSRGVVHSFTGTAQEATDMINLDLFIGFNGCSLKTEQNLDVVKHVPVERIMIETDAPWCDIRSTHAGFKFVDFKLPQVDKKKWKPDTLVKGRNEPCNIVQVLEVIAKCKEMDPQELSEQIYKNTCSVFFPQELSS
mmetsp:Transcript_1820/g.2331  ORF Transcript_1820/g.2331 Transcript_1820/m.2331 type:complete len:309 (+) Transcript_1820:38-964(+)